MKFNEKFLLRMQNVLGSEYEEFLKSLEKPSEKAIFVNQNKISLQNFVSKVDFPIEPISYEPNGFYIGDQRLGRHPLHHAGAFYIQEPSAMFTVNSFKFNGDEAVLDMCAAPGGKSIQIANRIPDGILVSNEFVHARAEILFSNIERMGLKNVIITNESPKNIANAYANTFDVCLVDAPCSGEGMFRKGEDMVEPWNENLPTKCSIRQKEILLEADKCLKSGGHLIYSTCTYSVEENENIVRWLQDLGYELENIDADLPRGINMPEAVRLYPHKVRGEGQFVAVLKKNNDNNLIAGGNLKLKECQSAERFLSKNTTLNCKAYSYDRFSYIVKDSNFIKKGINYISIGVRVGEEINNRFEPYHNLFSAFGCDFLQKLDFTLDDPRLNKYLKGETFDVDLLDGYAVCTVLNCPVGGIKISGGRMKNHYPKGLRNFK